MSLPPASGTGRFFAKAAKSIRLIRQGCTNRPFFHISVTQVSSQHTFLHFLLCDLYSLSILLFLSLILQRRRLNSQPVIEQLGSYDPMPNINNEKLVALNLERIKYWLGKGAHVSPPVAEILGMLFSLSNIFFSAFSTRSNVVWEKVNKATQV